MELIDKEKVLKELLESDSHHASNSRESSLLDRNRYIVRSQPTVEAYTKDVVIALLIQILDEISNKTAITKDSKDKIACALADGWNNSQLRDCEIIRAKIAELRGQTDG